MDSFVGGSQTNKGNTGNSSLLFFSGLSINVAGDNREVVNKTGCFRIPFLPVILDFFGFRDNDI